MPPRRRSDAELQDLPEPALFAYLVTMRDAGEVDAATEALWVFGYKRWDYVTRRLAVRVPASAVEDLAVQVIVRAAGAAFVGTSVGELVSLLRTIIKRVVADHLRGREGRRLEDDRAANALRDDETGELRDGGVDEPGFDLVPYLDVVDRELAKRTPPHRRAIELRLFEGYSSKEAAELTGLTPANVDQVVSRFKRDCRAWEAGDDA